MSRRPVGKESLVAGGFLRSVQSLIELNQLTQDSTLFVLVRRLLSHDNPEDSE